MRQIDHITGTGIPLLLDDIDTDRIIPARFLRCVTFEGIGEHAFEDDRQQDPGHPFNDPRFRHARILVAGRNFGCGSSREHAPQSLMRWGIQAIIAESYAEIFFGNCIALGIPALCAARSDLEQLAQAVNADPNLEITVDLKNLQVRFGNQAIECLLPPSVQEALLSGQWDFLGQLLDNTAAIERKKRELPYLSGFANV